MVEIITSIGVAIIVPIIMGLFINYREKEEKALTNNTNFKVKTTKSIRIFFFVWAVLILALMVIMLLAFLFSADVDYYIILIVEIVLAMFAFLGAFGFCYTNYNYLLVSKDKIIKVKSFKKNVEINYDEIAFFNSYMGGLSGVTAYDKYGRTLFAVDATYVGVEKLDALLKSKNIEIAPKNYPTESIKQTEEYKISIKRGKYILNKWLFFGFGLACFFLAFLILPQANFTEFKNTKVSGIIESVDTKKDTVSIKLYNDENIYYVNNVIYNALDEKVLPELLSNKDIILHIGYFDEQDRACLSQIEIGNKIYLRMEEAEAIDYNNFLGTKITGYIFLGIGVVLILLCTINSIKLLKLKNNIYYFDK